VVVFDLLVRELDDVEFYEGIENLKFFVHRYDAENLHHDALVRISNCRSINYWMYVICARKLLPPFQNIRCLTL
jgi:hypothetical protein